LVPFFQRVITPVNTLGALHLGFGRLMRRERGRSRLFYLPEKRNQQIFDGNILKIYNVPTATKGHKNLGSMAEPPAGFAGVLHV